jgi:uncharacterized protein DUF3618
MAQDPNQVSTADIRSQILHTRSELGHTIDAIQDRLSPRRVIHDAKETISDATLGRAKRLAQRVNDAVHSSTASPKVAAVLSRARENPTMTALIGTAVGALVLAVMSRSRRPMLAKGLGGLAMSLAMATIAQQRAQNASSRKPYQAASEPYSGAL